MTPEAARQGRAMSKPALRERCALVDLMRQIDRCEVNIVFFADEAGSWQVGVDWAEVLPAWFRSLSPATDPYEWAEAVVEALNDFAGYQMEPILAAARDIATPEQREALTEYDGNLRPRLEPANGVPRGAFPHPVEVLTPRA